MPCNFNAEITQLVSFDQSNNWGAINVEMDESVLEEKSTLKLSYVYTSLQSDTRPIYHFKVILAQSNVANLSLFYRFYFEQCYTEIVELVPFPLSDSQSTRYVNKQQLEYGILYLHIALLCGTSKFLKG